MGSIVGSINSNKCMTIFCKHLLLIRSRGGAHMFMKQYERKARQAYHVAYSSFLVEFYIGCLPPCEGKHLYTAGVDPHLTSGAEVSPDTTLALLEPLKWAQHTYLQHVLGLNPHCMCVFLFSETGLLLIPYRQLTLTLHFLIYLLNLPREHLAACAWHKHWALNEHGSRCWLGGLATALKRVLVDVSCLNTVDIQVETGWRITHLHQ